MAITNAQQYQQLVNKPANGKRPGYRGDYSYGDSSAKGYDPGGGKASKGSGVSTGSGGYAPTSQAAKGTGGYKAPTYTGGADNYQDVSTNKNNVDIAKKEKKKYQKQFTSKGKAPPGLNQKKRQRALDYVNRGLARYLDRFEEYYDEEDFGITKTGYPNFGFPNMYDAIGDELTARKNIKEIKKTGNKIPVGTSGNSYELSAVPDLDIDSIRELAATQTLAQGAPLTGYQANALEDLKRNIENRDTFLETGDTSVIYPDPPEATNTGPDPDPVDPCKGPNPPAYCFVGDDTEEDTTVPRNLGGLAPRFMGSSFDFTGLAEGGRVAAQQGGIMSQQGGSIMPRLNDLGTDVSSAEQMLQEINQRLQSAESTLGEGGGGGMGSLPSGFKQLPNGGMIGPAIPYNPNNFGRSINAYTPRQMPIGQPGLINLADIQPGTQPMSPFEEAMRSGALPNNTAQGFEGFAAKLGGPIISALQQPNMTEQVTSLPGGALQSPLAGAIRQGAMDGGRMRQMEMMEDEDDPTGGIMDLESGRQMYFLGKLVKKAGRAIKKVVKSPIGKAALLYFGGNALMSGGGGGLSSLFKSGKGLSLKNLIMGKPLGFKTAGDSVARSGGLLNFMKDNPYLSILGGSTALAGLSGKDKDEDGEIDYGPGIDIDRLRYAPYRTLAPSIVGSNYQTGTEGRKDGGRMGYQEGGDAEPVAKKTMPLLDMDGQEMDLRKEGGFVPLGRMERADDVPARLSKNEFVFTADAVRNAGEGDIDKGAEVMYNMMKNLESGGEVSEESQGLEGAREMFKTSQRLEEVL